MDILLPEFKRLLLLLNKHAVSYMLIGGYAVIYYGYERSTSDMDLWIEPTNENKDKLINALKEFNIGEESLNAVSLLDFKQIQFFYFGQKPTRIDFLTKVNGVTYPEAIAEVNYFPLGDEKVPIIQYHHLILTKISNNRLKDKADVEELQKINKFRNNE
jgi:hypothetical protein